MRGWWLLLAVLPSVGHAQQVYKCVQGKQTVYQSAPCPGQALKSWDATPQPVDPAITRRLQQMEAQVRARNRAAYRSGGSSPSGAVLSQHRNASACERARSEREAALARIGIRRTYEIVKYWDDRVWRACK